MLSGAAMAIAIMSGPMDAAHTLADPPISPPTEGNLFPAVLATQTKLAHDPPSVDCG
jgi:hypothetical protein